MKNRKKGSKVLVLVILLLAVSLGYALLSTTLKINGFSHITKGIWDIHWDNVANESGVTPTVAAYIKDNTKKQIVEYEVLLAKPGDYYEFTVDAVNEGTYDGIITKIESKVNGEALSTLPNYVKYSVVYANDGTEPALNDTLDVEERRTYKVRVEYDASVVTNELINENLNDEVIVTVIATGFDKSKKEPQLKQEPQFVNPQPRRLPPREDYSYQPEVLDAGDNGESGSGNVDIEMPSFLRERNF